MSTTTWTDRGNDTLGPHVCRWIEANCILGEGDSYGKPVHLERFQRRFLYQVYEIRPDGTRQFPEVLFGVPKNNGKTPLGAWIALHELDCDECSLTRGAPLVPVAAASFDQADLVFGDMGVSARESDTLRPRLQPFDTEILRRGRPGRAWRVAAVRGTNDGGRPSCFVADEFHEWLTPAHEGAWLVLTNGTAKRYNSLRLYVTTAGSDPQSLLGQMYAKGKRIAQQVATGEPVEDERFLMVWYEAEGDVDITDPAALRTAVRGCNPGADLFVDVDAVVGRFAVIPEFEARRYYLNQWTEADESWLPPGTWRHCQGDAEISADLPITLGVDMAFKHDDAAVVLAQIQDDKTVVRSRVWHPPEGGVIDVIAVEKYIRDLHNEYTVKAVGFDPAYFGRSAQVLEDDGVIMVEFIQTSVRMVPACAFAYEQIVAGKVLHNGDPTLTDHVLSAAPRESDNGWRLSKGKSKRHIDACIAMVMALWLSHEPPAAAVPAFFL